MTSNETKELLYSIRKPHYRWKDACVNIRERERKREKERRERMKKPRFIKKHRGNLQRDIFA